MKNTILPILCVLITTLMIAAIPTEAEYEVYTETVRLHILANSDSEEDQKTKLELRDAILCKFGVELKSLSSAKEASEELSSLLPKIEKFAEDELKRKGTPNEVKAYVSTEWYETREYEAFTLPCGYYTSLKVIIGEGKGKNWWCVMFPPLCLDIACESEKLDTAPGYSTAVNDLISPSGYNCKFKILELLSSLAK